MKSKVWRLIKPPVPIRSLDFGREYATARQRALLFEANTREKPKTCGCLENNHHPPLIIPSTVRRVDSHFSLLNHGINPNILDSTCDVDALA